MIVFVVSSVGGCTLPSLDRLLDRYPEHELAIRRLFRREPEFCAVCDDYDAVCRALEHWQTRDEPVPERIAEYRRMLVELEAEALAFLDPCGKAAGDLST